MKLLSLSDVLGTYQETHPTEYTTFYQNFLSELGKLVNLTKVTKITEDIRLKAVLNVPGIPPVFSILLSKMQARVSIVSKKTSEPKKSVGSPTKTTPTLSRPAVLSNRRAKLLRPILTGYITPYPRVCKLLGCQVCKELVTSITLTRCSHGGKIHPHEWFPHLPDSVVASAHAGSKVISPYEGATNPCVPAKPPAAAPMEVVEAPVAEVVTTEPSPIVVDTPVEPTVVKKTRKSKRARAAVDPDPIPETPESSAERDEAFIRSVLTECIAHGATRGTALRIIDDIGFARTASIVRLAKEVESLVKNSTKA